MVYDSIANALIPTPASNPKDFNKKKRVNRTAKLKQSKLDVRREQWLSQVKNKGCKEENRGTDRPKTRASDMHPSNEGETRTIGKLVINRSGEENDGLMNHYSDWESPSNSPTSHTSSLASNRSVTNFTGGSSSRSSSSSSGGCYSGSMTEEDDGDDGCLDDWEAIADALAADEIKSDHNVSPEPQVHDHNVNPEPVETVKDDRVQVNRRAWRPDDAFRPQGLPNLLKQNSFPMNSERNHGCGAWGFKNAGLTPVPTTCPICCEDLDLTDSSFLPCPCGYRLCLFCYKRILEDNGRCPGCRKQYEQPEQGIATSKLARSYSMIPSR
ncbi:putative transcription factor C2H2 family [Helianthus annuus]|nr:putative transcription factor C2H2 family [Helianthus annuus]